MLDVLRLQLLKNTYVFYFFNNNFDTKTRMSGYFTSSSNKTNDGISDSEYNKFE